MTLNRQSPAKGGINPASGGIRSREDAGLLGEPNKIHHPALLETTRSGIFGFQQENLGFRAGLILVCV